jgi:hypothetical protein
MRPKAHNAIVQEYLQGAEERQVRQAELFEEQHAWLRLQHEMLVARDRREQEMHRTAMECAISNMNSQREFNSMMSQWLELKKERRQRQEEGKK